jgi:EAL domain-containing protein (putative c-di-GMP-specific phosphodiesterase class I)
MNAQAKAATRTAALSGVLEYLNTREFARHAAGEPTLFSHQDRIRAHYASFSLDSLFQPLFDFQQRRIIGHEALLASVTNNGTSAVGNVLSPERVFTLAANEDITFVDRLARTLHALNFLLQDASGMLHLNVHPHHLLAVSADHGRVFEGILKQCGLDTRRIVLEIPEYAVPEKRRLADAIAAWQEKGYQIAIDNVGREPLQVSRLRKLKPRYLKLDRQLLQQALLDRRRLGTLSNAVAVAMADGISVIGTGIESRSQLDVLHELGVAIGQGYLFGRPQPYCVAL